jgi:phosphopantothenoylcysteine decarboxylase / phosphopantothenate---cysteine ligase
VHLLSRGSDAVVTVGPTSKDEVADALWDTVSAILG